MLQARYKLASSDGGGGFMRIGFASLLRLEKPFQWALDRRARRHAGTLGEGVSDG
jgi:hypothetical protein